AQPEPLSAHQTPPGVERAIQICLAKNPDDRWQTARDLKRELLRPAEPAPAGVRTKRATAWMMIVMAALVCVAAAAIAGYFSKAGNRDPMIRAAIVPPEKGAFRLEGRNGSAAVSPDGGSLAFIATVAGRTSL